MVELPPVVRNKALALGARTWLDELEGVIAHLTREWQLTLGRVFPDATEAFVAEATLVDGTEAALKLALPTSVDAAAHEITVLRLAGGEGCARLFRYDATVGALLVERLGPSMYELGLPIDERHQVLCAAASRVWRPAAGAGLPTGAEKARGLAELVTERWEALDRPCSEEAVDECLHAAARRERAHDDERAVLVHGDVHQWNALRASHESARREGDTFKLIDPDGLLAEAEYDLGVIMREDPLELTAGDPRQRSRRLAALTDLDETAIWDWGLVERVSTGLLATMIDLQPAGREMLAAADAVSASSS